MRAMDRFSSSRPSSRSSPTSIASISITTPDIEAIRAAFTEFVNKVPFYGAAILCLDDENVQSILPSVKRRTITYGRNSQADYQPGDARSPETFTAVSLCARGRRTSANSI